jgi:hypothetical protein
VRRQRDRSIPDDGDGEAGFGGHRPGDAVAHDRAKCGTGQTVLAGLVLPGAIAGIMSAQAG